MSKKRGIYIAPLLVVSLVLLGIALVEIVRSESAPRIDSDGREINVDIREWACPPGVVGRVTCSFVSVPENYDDPEIRSISLFVARIAPPLDTTASPVVFVGNRLGEVTVQNFIEWQGVARKLQREVILVDQRGTGRSQPRLSCPELTPPQLEWLEADLGERSLATVTAQRNERVAQCYARLARSYPLEAYSFDALVEDLEHVREILKVEKWVLAAGGDATFVARAAEAEHPDSVEALVLLGASPTSAHRHVQRYDNAREVLAAALDAEGLAPTLDQALAQLEDQTIVFAVNAAGRTVRVAVSAQTVRPALARAAADGQTGEVLQRLVTERLTGGRWRGLALTRAEHYRVTPDWAPGMALAVACGEPSFASAEPLWSAVEDFDPQWTALVDNPTLDPGLCDAWPGAAYDSFDDAPGARTLVVNGEYDVAAPQSDADVWHTWQIDEVRVIPQGGQPDPFDPCVVDLVTRFLDNSSSTIAATCA